MSNITFAFTDSDLKISISKEIFNKYHNSSFYGFIFDFNVSLITLNDINYNDFMIIYDVLHDNKKQFDVPEHIYNYMDKHGLVNQQIHDLYLSLTKQTKKKLSLFDSLINGKESLIIVDDKELYTQFKSSMPNNIISVQITYLVEDILRNEIILIHIMDCLPIFYHKIYKSGYKTISLTSDDISSEINIIDIRKKFFFDKQGSRKFMVNECDENEYDSSCDEEERLSVDLFNNDFKKYINMLHHEILALYIGVADSEYVVDYTPDKLTLQLPKLINIDIINKIINKVSDLDNQNVFDNKNFEYTPGGYTHRHDYDYIDCDKSMITIYGFININNLSLINY